MASLRCPACKQLIHSETIVDNEIMTCPYCHQRLIVPPFKVEPIAYPVGTPALGSALPVATNKSTHQGVTVPRSKNRNAFSRKVRFITRQGKFLFRDSFSDAQDYHEGLAGFARLYGIESSFCPLEWGFLNDRGETVIEPFYTDVLPFSEGFAGVRTSDGVWGFADSTGELVIPARFKEAFSFMEGWALVKLAAEGKNGAKAPLMWDFIDAMGRRLTDFDTGTYRFQEARVFKGSLAAVKIDQKWGFINRRGKLIIPCHYERVTNFDGGFAAVEYRRSPRAKALWGVIDMQGKIRIPPQYEEVGAFAEGLVLVKVDGLWGFSDADGQVMIPPVFQEASPFFGEYAIVKKDDKYGLLQKNGEYQLPPVYDSISAFRENRAIVSSAGKCGAIDPSGRVVIPFAYDFLGDFSEGLAPALADNCWGYVNRQGQMVIPAKFSHAESFVNGFARVEE